MPPAVTPVSWLRRIFLPHEYAFLWAVWWGPSLAGWWAGDGRPLLPLLGGAVFGAFSECGLFMACKRR